MVLRRAHSMKVINAPKQRQRKESNGIYREQRNVAYFQVAWLDAKCRLLFAKHLSNLQTQRQANEKKKMVSQISAKR